MANECYIKFTGSINILSLKMKILGTKSRGAVCSAETCLFGENFSKTVHLFMNCVNKINY